MIKITYYDLRSHTMILKITHYDSYEHSLLLLKSTHYNS